MKIFNGIPFLTLLIFINFQGITQHNYPIYGVVKDTLDNPVDFANIGVLGKNVGTVSNENGFFHLSIPDDLINDSITFSRIGFYTKRIAISNLKGRSYIEIALVPKITKLEEIQITGKQLKEKTKGNKTESHSIVLAFNSDSSHLGFETGAVVNLPNKSPVKIKDFNFNITFNNPDSAKFRLNIYDYSKQEIGESLLHENIYFAVYKKDIGRYRLDLSKYNIYASGKVFVSLENIAVYVSKIPPDQEKNYYYDRINISGTIKIAKGFRRKVSLGNWEKLPFSFAPGFWITILE